MDFPGGPVGKTPRFQCRQPALDPWSGIPATCMLQLRARMPQLKVRMPQLRPGTAKINKSIKKKMLPEPIPPNMQYSFLNCKHVLWC